MPKKSSGHGPSTTSFVAPSAGEVSASYGVAVIIPCLNEGVTIEGVVQDFRAVLPDADIYVFDNGSSDATVELAKRAGANVRTVLQRGKGAVLRQAFAAVEAEYYVVVDGDATYPANEVLNMLKKAREGADMVCGDRLSLNEYKRSDRQNLHNFGNHLICTLITLLLGVQIRDALTGYRVLSRRFVKNCPVLLDGFEVETEMTIHAVGSKFNILEVPISYGHRPEGSHSKIRTFQDGMLIMRAIVWLGKDTKPLKFFGVASLLFLLLSLGLLGSSLTAGAWGCFIVAVALFSCGLILDTVTKQHLQNHAVLRMNR